MARSSVSLLVSSSVSSRFSPTSVRVSDVLDGVDDDDEYDDDDDAIIDVLDIDVSETPKCDGQSAMDKTKQTMMDRTLLYLCARYVFLRERACVRVCVECQ
jgi:hypothetical protein